MSEVKITCIFEHLNSYLKLIHDKNLIQVLFNGCDIYVFVHSDEIFALILWYVSVCVIIICTLLSGYQSFSNFNPMLIVERDKP